uniref:Angiopoietin-related protein 1-like n=1 Tax=Saccoglossus kowalevskii TaxID=10224 RepID=A0ABM0MIZ1_SACKO|nr:PREDICTED: angiopoietin-related protein 1-like [Saccoglossus kowalevskii]
MNGKNFNTNTKNTEINRTTFQDTKIIVSFFKDCQDVYDAGHTTSGVYTIWPLGASRAFPVDCEMKNGNGWTIIQRRYSEGFGEVYGEFWLGNDNLFYLTNGNGKQYELRVDLTDWRANSTQAIYSGFRIEDAFNRYRLWLSFYGGAAGDSMSISNGAQFSTFDSDNDDVINADYGKRYSGGWWYSMWFSDDHTANLNGKFYDNGDYNIKQIMS